MAGAQANIGYAQLMRRNQTTSDAPQRSPAKEKLVGLAGAAWRATAVQLALPGLQKATSLDERDALINQLVHSLVNEAQAQLQDDPVLAEVWREAALEAACARLEALEHVT